MGNGLAYGRCAAGGRFLSVDPVITDANAGNSFNRYVYAKNSPYRYIDPDGRQAMVACVGGPVPCVVGAAVTAVTAIVIAVKGGDVIKSATNSDSKKDDGSNSEGSKPGDKHPSTPTGQSGSPIDVPKGTNAPANIGGRDYSGHALDQSQGRGVTPTVVDDAISSGSARPDSKYPDTRTEHTSKDGKVIVITDTESGRVITVIAK